MIRQVITPTTATFSGETGTQQVDVYLEKLLKLIPAESVAVYMTLDGVLRSAVEGDQLRIWLWIVFAVVLVGNVFYLRRTNVKAPLQYVIMELAFVVWVISLGGPFSLYEWYQPFIGSITLVLFTFVVAPFYKGTGGA